MSSLPLSFLTLGVCVCVNVACVFYFLQEWAEELFNLASNLLVQNMSREACLEKAYVTGCMHTRTHARTQAVSNKM